jgi:hypothetical protein
MNNNKYVLLLTTFAAAALCSNANARNIIADGWQPTSTAGTGTSVTVDPSNLASGASLTGINSMSISVGDEVNNYLVSRVVLGDMHEVQYGFFAGPPPFATDPNTPGDEAPEQVIIETTTTGPTSSFDVILEDAAQGTEGIAHNFGVNIPERVTINGITYTANDPFDLTVTTSDLKFQNGMLVSLPSGWTSSAVSAPEIDPSSAGSGLTLLIGGIAVLMGARPRRRVAR